MNTNIYGELGYSGYAKISLINNSTVIQLRVVHNAGTALMFHMIAHCLAGNYAIAADLAPGKLSLKNLLLTYIKLNVYQSTTPKVVVDLLSVSPSCSVTFSFKIPYASMVIPEDGKLAGFELCSKTTGEVLANIELDEPFILAAADLNTILLIDWTLKISNKNNLEESGDI